VATSNAGVVEYRAALVRSDGTLLNRVATYNPMNGSVVVVVYTITVSDPSVHLIRETTASISTTKVYENVELLYTDTNASALNITYREFSPDGLARVAFFQNLTYESGTKSLTFK